MAILSTAQSTQNSKHNITVTTKQ